MNDPEPQVEIVVELGIVRERDYLYFVRENEVRRVRADGNAAGEPEVVAKFDAERDPSYLYFLTSDGHVARVRRPITDSGVATDLDQRDAVYRELWGPPETVAHEIVPRSPHVDIYVHPPGHHGRDFYTLVTRGMSDVRLVSQPPFPKRVEMVMYVREPREQHTRVMNALAHHAHDARSPFWFGLTLPNGDPPQPYFEDSELPVMYLTQSIVRPDVELPRRLSIEGDPVELLWMVPITSRECELKLRHGQDALLRLFNERALPHVLDEQRKSLV